PAAINVAGARGENSPSRSRVRIVSGALEKHVPGVPGLWRIDPRGMSCVMAYSPAGYPGVQTGLTRGKAAPIAHSGTVGKLSFLIALWIVAAGACVLSL